MASLLLIALAAVVASLHAMPPSLDSYETLEPLAALDDFIIKSGEQEVAIESAGYARNEDPYWCEYLPMELCSYAIKWCNKCKTDVYVPTCGKVNRMSKIVGGIEAEIHEYPWQVAMTYSWWYNHTMVRCGGSIINEMWILTAAHCVDGPRETKEYMLVRVGEHRWSTESETGATQIHVIEEVLMHPNYKASASHNNDIALLKLAKPLTFDSHNKIAPVCPPIATELYDNVDAITTGWGTLTQWGSSPDSLQEVIVPTITNSACASAYLREGRPGTITENMICAGYPEGGKDSCQGDSGGPLITADGSIYRLIGVVSWGSGCGDPGVPGVYTRITNKLDWIAKTISGTNWN